LQDIWRKLKKREKKFPYVCTAQQSIFFVFCLILSAENENKLGDEVKVKKKQTWRTFKVQETNNRRLVNL
jgi:hypothetical protein